MLRPYLCGAQRHALLPAAPPEEVLTCVATLLAYGCPPQAIVAAFGLDERTVAAWQQRAGQHCEQVHRDLVREVDAQHVQADELWVKLVGRKLWLALALAVPSRLWLGGVLGARDRTLIDDLVLQVRRGLREWGILVCVDGLSSYVTAFQRAFKVKVRTGEGRPRRVLAEGFLLGQVLKSRVRCRVADVAHRAVIGSLAAIEARLQATGGGRVINTAYVERLNATFRGRLAALVRRGRCLARTEATLQASVYLVGVVYNCCQFHDSLRQAASSGGRRQWQERTPAMAAGLTPQRWSVSELLHYRIPPGPWQPPGRRKRPANRPYVARWKLRPNRVTLCPNRVTRCPSTV